jgi:hypothetical protein
MHYSANWLILLLLSATNMPLLLHITTCCEHYNTAVNQAVDLHT